ncbi:hypothetical protein [Pyrococcus abyssi]|nr:hypothetical protein [Pyrococcus abyssi]CCE70536.1 TPA: hypothetical protein PAB1625 [Pyrococcus abyssi GE5]
MRKTLAVFLLLLGYFLAILTVYFLGYEFSIKPFALGIVGIIIALIIQFPLQLLVIFLRDKLNLGTLLVSIGLGFSAGFSQELVKYLFLHGKEVSTGIMFGLGIGFFEVLYAIPVVFYEEQLPEHMKKLVEKNSWLGAWERYFGTLFHIATSAILTYAGLGVLVLFMLLHGLVDSLAEMHNLGESKKALFLGEVLLSILSVLLILSL